MAGDLKDLEEKLRNLAQSFPEDCLSIIETEGLSFIHQNWQDQGFNDHSLEKWKPRKTTDRNGRDLTRYRTNRKGRQGDLTKFGQQNIDRAILVGHQTGGDKLRNSFRARREKLAVVFYTYKPYAIYHNEGTEKLPKRQFMGESQQLNQQIQKKIEKTLNDLLR